MGEDPCAVGFHRPHVHFSLERTSCTVVTTVIWVVLVKEGRELGFDVAGSRLVGSRRTVEECFTATCGVEDLVGGSAKAALSLFASGVKTGCTLQKCSFRLRNCGSDGRLGIRVFYVWVGA